MDENLGDGQMLSVLVEMIATSVAAKLRTQQAPSPTSIAPELVSKTEATRALRIHRATLDRAVRSGCPYDTFNGRRVFDLAACREWFRTHRASTTTPENDSINVDHLARRMGVRSRRK